MPLGFRFGRPGPTLSRAISSRSAATSRCNSTICSHAAHMRSDHHAGRTWGKRGETPVVETTGARHRMNLISAITARGHMRFMIKEKGGVNADVFIEFLGLRGV